MQCFIDVSATNEINNLTCVIINSFLTEPVLQDWCRLWYFTLANARRFYLSRGDPQSPRIDDYSISHVSILIMCMQLQSLLYFCGATGDWFLYDRTILIWMHGNVKYISDVGQDIFLSSL